MLLIIIVWLLIIMVWTFIGRRLVYDGVGVPGAPTAASGFQ
jgi:hypothetical protein